MAIILKAILYAIQYGPGAISLYIEILALIDHLRKRAKHAEAEAAQEDLVAAAKFYKTTRDAGWLRQSLAQTQSVCLECVA